MHAYALPHTAVEQLVAFETFGEVQLLNEHQVWLDEHLGDWFAFWQPHLLKKRGSILIPLVLRPVLVVKTEPDAVMAKLYWDDLHPCDDGSIIIDPSYYR